MGTDQAGGVAVRARSSSVSVSAATFERVRAYAELHGIPMVKVLYQALGRDARFVAHADPPVGPSDRVLPPGQNWQWRDKVRRGGAA